MAMIGSSGLARRRAMMVSTPSRSGMMMSVMIKSDASCSYKRRPWASLAVSRDLVTLLFEHAPEHRAQLGLVVDDEYPRLDLSRQPSENLPEAAP